MRLLSRIFGGFVLFAALVFGGVSSSFADNMSCKEGMTYYPEVGDCCFAFDGKSCISDFNEWVAIVESLKCEGGSGAYVNSDGNIVCCPEKITQPNKLYQCECYDKRFEFNPKTGGCDQCKFGMTWYPDVPKEGACCYFFDDDHEIDCLTTLEHWIDFANDNLGCGEKGAYVDINNKPHCCPKGTIANEYYGCSCEDPAMIFNNATGVCGCPAGYFFDGAKCLTCPDGFTCLGGLYEPQPNVYTITLKNYNNTDTHQTIYEKYNTGWYSNSAATTPISTATVPSRTGYTFRGFYTSTRTDATSSGNTGTQIITKTGGLPNNRTFAANTTLYAAWAKNCEDSSNCALTVADNGAVTYTTSCPNGYVSGEGTYNPVCQSSGTANCYRIDFDNTTNGGTGGAPTSVYMYRDTPTYTNSSNQSKWCKLYTDSACTTELANNDDLYTIPTTNPTKPHATFHHYVGSNGYSQPFRRSYINYNSSYSKAWEGCIYPDDAYEGIYSLGFDASQTPSLTFNAVYSCDEGWRGNCTTLSGNTYDGYYCYSNTACTASPTSTISFNANGGSGGRSGTVTATYGSIVPVITTSNWTTPHRFGYNFGGYFDSNTGGNYYYSSTGAPASVWDKTTNTTLYARWTQFNGGKLYFYNSVDTSPSYGSILCERTSCTLPTYSTAGITKPSDATWLGWAFLCGNYEYCGTWGTSGTGLYGTGSSNGAATVTNNNSFFGRYNEDELDSSFATGLRACWQFDITYNLNPGANPSGTSTTYNTTYNNCLNTTLLTPTRENYIFGGWYENSSFTGHAVTTIAAGSTGAKTYYAKWTESPCWHTVLDNTTYGGSGGATDIYINRSTCNVYANAGCTGSAITALPSTPNKINAGYTGHYNPAEPGWGALITTSGSDRFTNLKTECNANRFYNTLVAKYSCNDGHHAASSATNAVCVANSYSVHFNSNCPTTVSGTMSNQSFTYGIAQNLTNNGFSCTGYTFAGWATSASGAKVYDNQQSVSNLTTTNDGTFELYAKWSVETYGISYVLNGGLSVDLDTYTPVEYVSSKSANSAFSYFDTGTKFDFGKDFRVVGKFSNPNTSARHILLGSYTSADNVFNIELKTSPTGAFRTYFASGADGNTSQAIAANTWTAYDVFYDPILRKSKTIAGTQNFTLSVPNGTGEVAKNMRMFLDHRTSTSAIAYPVKMAATAMYKNNALVNYYVPVRNSSNVCGMYDAKNNVFKASATAAPFDCPSTTTMPTSFAYDTGTTISGVPVRAYSQFAGWCTNSALTQGCAMTKTIAANSTNSAQTFYAKWTCDAGYHASGNACVANSYSVHFNSNCPTTVSGTMNNQSFTYGIAQNLTNNGFTCTNRAFQGWATSSNGSVAYSNGQSVNNLTTTNGGIFELYAVWTATACDAGEYLNNGTCNACPTGYTSNGATATSQADCFINCPAGYRVATPGGTCDDSGNGPWVTTNEQTVYYGNISPVTYCMYGYKTMGSTYHSSINSCNRSVNAGYYVAHVLPDVTSISISSTDELRLAEIGAYKDYNGTDAFHLSLSSGNGTNLGWATDGTYNSVAIIPAGNTVVWQTSAKINLHSIRIALANPAKDVTITAHSAVNGDVVVFQGDINHSIEDQVQGWAVAPTGELIVLSSIPMVCPAGQYSMASYAYLPIGTSCSDVTAGYYTSGGGTSATPTAAGNGCLSGKTCGKCPTGWPHSAAGSNEITDCYSNTKSRAWSGTQVACTNPDTTGCSAVTCASCSNSACNYVAYVNASGNADGTIKSGCATNNASCQQTVASLTPNTGYHTTSGNLEYCPANTYTVTFNANGGTGSPSESEITCVYDDACPAFATQGTLSKTNATFGGWNTASDGTGTSYAEGATPTNLTSTNGAAVPLYAVWIISGCPGGQYLNSGLCISCPAGYSCAGEETQPVMCATNTYSTGGAASCTACTGGLTTSSVADSRYHDEVADCGRILHVGAYEIRLKSIPANANISTTVPSPSLRFNYAGNANGRPDFYANMSPIASPMRVTSTGLISTTGSGDKFKTRYNNTNYYVCDDVTCVTE